MEIHHLKTFITVAREGSITRASELLHLSQPAVSAQIKALEDELDLPLFDRTSRGMTLTADGRHLLAKAEQTLGAHQELMAEAKRLKGRLTGKLRLGGGSNANNEAIGRLVTDLSQRCPEVEIAIKHGTSEETLAGIRNGTLDAGFYNEAGAPDPDLTTVEISRFKIYLAARPGLVPISTNLDWKALEDLSWIYPFSSTCCGRTAESLFETHRIRPKRITNVDRENITRGLIASGVGVGLLHEGTANEAQKSGEVELLVEARASVRVLFAHLATRAQDPVVTAARAIVTFARP